MKLLNLCVPSLVFSMFVSGCHIENHHEDVQGGGDGDTCGTYCLHLYECASIADSQMGSCLDECNVKLRVDAEATRSACECVLGDECRALGAYDCPGAPVPGGGAEQGTGGASSGGGAPSAGGASGGSSASSPGSGGAVSGVGGSSSAAGGPALGCQGGYECGASEDCVDGACRQRCTASCQCPTDLSCIDHYCRSATPPPACNTDCECASGQHCVSGSCS